MNNKIISVVAIILSIVAIIYTKQSQTNIAYVNNSVLLEKFYGVIEANKALEAQKKSWNDNLALLEEDVNKMIADYRDNYEQLNTEDKKNKEALIQSKQQQYFDYKKVVEEQQKEASLKSSVEVINQMNGYIKTYGNEQGFDIIIGITSEGNVLYGKEELDITNKVLGAINAKYEGK